MLYNESCMDTLSRLVDGSIDLVITSPPYNMRTRIRDGKYTTREKSEHFSKKYKYFDDALSIDEFYMFHSGVMRELLRVSKIVCYNFQIVTGSKESFFQMIGDFKKNIKDIMIWNKGHGQPAMHEKILNRCYEMILILEGDDRAGRMIRNAKFERGKMNDVLNIKRGKRVSKSHAATFPEELVNSLLVAFSDVGDLIYDPFLGTGTVAKCCIDLNRRWMGSEISEEYCKITMDRIEATTNILHH